MQLIQNRFTRKPRPVRVVQFGEGNFLRGFVEDMLETANERGTFDGSVAIVKPTDRGDLQKFREQDNFYTLLLRGRIHGKPVVQKRVITCIENVVDPYADTDAFFRIACLDTLQIVVSNTTEAGIIYDENEQFMARPAKTYPGKLTQFLFARFQYFHGAPEKGLLILPVELIEKNGEQLRTCVLRLADLWQLGTAFRQWVLQSNSFCNTLVDRIVSGYPKAEAEQIQQELGYRDVLLDTGEPFALWVIETDCEQETAQKLPLAQAGCPVNFVKKLEPYRERKVRILNGAHTSSVLAGYLMGKEFVRDCMQDSLMREFMETAVLREIVPTVPLPESEAKQFAQAVFERFDNPFVAHSLLAISLNSVSKWRVRVLPSLRDRLNQTGALPVCLTFSLAALLAFYTSDCLQDGVLLGSRGGEPYEVHDDRKVLAFFAASSKQKAVSAFVNDCLAQTAFWGEDLTRYPGLAQQVTEDLTAIRQTGIRQAVSEVLQKAKREEV
ncbi:MULTISPECIES: tagaturonate reductase [Caproicibacterium]|uniref:Tagaturonate reductase n=1 Tax=Caproicibacterium argilliputei TaxID=3030016 RepID=A0AA97DBQ1_9FIRM|nr:tagaturonate reductase [Caproicibacterium argilliputei]WOC32834.1 tagaturonate reductase [Caproicibacterium argilliputei]